MPGREAVQGGPSIPVFIMGSNPNNDDPIVMEVTAIERKNIQCEIGTTSTSGLELFSAPGAGRRYYITALQLQSESDTALQAEIRSGGKVLARVNCQNNGDGKIEDFAPGFEQPARTNQPITLWISGAYTINYQVRCYEDAA